MSKRRYDRRRNGLKEVSGDRILRTSSGMIGKDEFGNLCLQERGKKEVRDCVFVVMKLLLVCGVRNWSLMVFVLFVKKVAKSSVDEGGGGGGQRREDNFLKSARESEQLLILLW